MPAAVLSVLVQARGIQQTNAGLTGLQGGLKATEGAATRMGKQLAKGLKIAALGAAAGIAAAVKAAVDFDKEMRNVNSIAQLPERRFGKLREKVLALAGPTAQAPKTLAAGLYDLVSSGFDANESLKILAKSARAATAGLTTTEVSTKAVAAVLNAYELPARKAGEVSDQLFETVNRGVLTFEELANSVGDVLPYSSQLGIGLGEVGASVATMTKAGINAPETMTRLKAAMVTLLKPGEALKDVLKGMGVNGEELLEKRGFLGALEAIVAQTDGTKEAVAGLFPNVRALGGVMALTGIHTKSAQEDLKAFSDTAGATNRALSQQEKSTAFQWQQLKAQVEVLAIGFGEKLLPEINKVIKVITDPKLTTQEKFSAVFDLISGGAQKAFNSITRAAVTYGPRIIGALASSMGRAWTQMDPLAKLLSAAALIRVLGGKGAITASGAAIGRMLGIGVSTGAAETVALSGAASTTEATVGGAVAGQAAGAGMGAGMLAALKSVKWGRVGMLGVGLTLADNVITEFGRRSEERSGDVSTALKAMAKGTEVGISGTPLHLNLHKNRNPGGMSLDPFGLLSETPEEKATKNLLAQVEELEHHRRKISGATEQQLRLEANELDLTKKQRTELDSMFALMRQGRKLDLGIGFGMDPGKLSALAASFRTLRSGDLTSLGDIGMVVQRNAQIIETQLPKASQDARDQMAENFRSAAKAIKEAMDHGDISVKEGLARQKDLLRNAHLISGDDPFDIAKGFASSWKKAGGISAQQRQDMIADLAKMPPAARQKAFDAMVNYGQGLVKGGKIPKQDLRDFRSAALAQFSGLAGGVGGSFKNLGTDVGSVLQGILGDVESALASLGVKVAVKQFALSGSEKGFTYSTKQSKNQARQMGGAIVPGTGSGDTFHTALPPGSFILNRKATKAYGFARGGLMPVALEPGERRFLPHEVKAMGGVGTLEAINKSVPRFQQGGQIGKPELTGPAGPLLDMGRQSIALTARAAQEFVAKHQPQGGAFGPKGIGTYKGVPMANWVIEALAYAASKGIAPQPTSGYRSHAQNVSEGRTYFSEHEKTQYPGGAVDFGARYGDPAAKAAKMAVVNATRDFKYPLLAPIGFIDDGHASGTGHQFGGLVQALIDGGVITGKVSWFGGGATAGGSNTSLPGLALNLKPGTEEGWNNATTQAWRDQSLAGHPVFGATKIAGHAANLPITDMGPAASTGRAIDVTEGGVRKLGLSTANFPTDSTGTVKILGGGAGMELTAGQKQANEGKARKANYERHLAALASEVSATHSIPAKQSKLWKLIKFWGRVGSFDKDEHAHILEAVQNAASQTKPKGAVSALQNLADYAKGHGEITGQDPSNFRDMTKAIERAQDRGHKQRENTVERQRKAVQRARDKAKSKILGRAEFPGIVANLAGLRRGADIQEEFASQLVTLEPEGMTDAYVGQERGAYGGELDRLLGWRNSVVRAQDYASETIQRLQWQIEQLQVWDVPGDKQAMQHFNKEKWKLPVWREAITNAKTMRDETWAGELEEIQGIGGPTGALFSLPSEPTAGSFGGRIFETQNAIRELGLQVPNASGAAGGDSERASLLEKLLREANQRTAVSEAQGIALQGWDAARQGYAGMFAKGGVIPAGMFGIAGETGKAEIVQGPARVFSPSESDSMMGGGHSVVVNLFEGEGRAEVEIDGKTMDAIVNHQKFAPAAQKAARTGRPTGIGTAGGARR